MHWSDGAASGVLTASYESEPCAEGAGLKAATKAKNQKRQPTLRKKREGRGTLGMHPDEETRADKSDRGNSLQLPHILFSLACPRADFK